MADQPSSSTTTIGSISSSTTERTDTVRWSDGPPTAPIIIPILFFVVVGTAFTCLVIRYLKKVWNRKRRSETYEIVDLMRASEEQQDEPQQENEPSTKPGAVPTLNFIRFTGVSVERRVTSHYREEVSQALMAETDRLPVDDEVEEADLSLSPNGGVSMQVEANVHDSSNEANDSPLDDVESDDQVSNNSETQPRGRKKKAPLAATESDV